MYPSLDDVMRFFKINVNETPRKHISSTPPPPFAQLHIAKSIVVAFSPFVTGKWWKEQ